MEKEFRDGLLSTKFDIYFGTKFILFFLNWLNLNDMKKKKT